jgi:hypothetical protein
VGSLGFGTRTLALRGVDDSGSTSPPMLIPVALVPESLTGQASAPAKLVAYATDGAGMIPGSRTEIPLVPGAGPNHSFLVPLTPAVPGAAQVVSYLVSETGETSPLFSTSFLVVVEGTNGYLAWLNAGAWFTPDELADESKSGLNADPDGDGLPNKLEFALHTHPRESSQGAIPQVSFAAGRMLFTFRQITGGGGHRAYNYTSEGVRYRVEWSNSLVGAWQGGGSEAFEVRSVTTNGDGTDTVVVAVEPTITTGQPKVFLRLKVLLL